MEQAEPWPETGGRRSTPLAGPAADAAVLSFKQTHYADWSDHPVPALDGLSPREAAENPTLRARRSQPIKEMEELEGRGPAGQRFNFNVIGRELRASRGLTTVTGACWCNRGDAAIGVAQRRKAISSTHRVAPAGSGTEISTAYRRLTSKLGYWVELPAMVCLKALQTTDTLEKLVPTVIGTWR